VSHKISVLVVLGHLLQNFSHLVTFFFDPNLIERDNGHEIDSLQTPARSQSRACSSSIKYVTQRELNTTLTPHSMIHGDACFPYFNKIWGIPPGHA
jgi:hypothetical protein